MRSSLCSAMLALVILASACSKSQPTEPQPPTNPGASAAVVDSANDSLGSVMQTAIDSILQYGDSTFRPSDMDFTGVYAMYQRALVADPGNLDAQFGAGFTVLLTCFADPDLNSLYERTKQFIDTTLADPNWQWPVRGIPVPGGVLGPDLFPTGFPLSPGGVPGVLPDLPRLDRALQVSAAADPQPSDWQDVLDTRIRPKVKTAQGHLVAVTANRNYVFWITPEMQGNAGADSIELDMTEVRLALAALYGFEAVIDVATARHLDFTEYSRNGLNEAFNVGSTFLTLKPTGAAKMVAAKDALLETLAQADSALEFLRTESDLNQDDDLIPQGSDVAEIRDSVRSAKLYLTQTRSVEVSNGGYTLTTDVSFGSFFDNAWQDPKALSPAYTITFDIDSSYLSIETMYFSAQTYWDSLFSKFGVVPPNDTSVYPSHLPDVKNNQYYEVLTQCQTVWGWTGLQTFSGPSDNCGFYSAWSQWDFQSAWYGRNELTVCLEWQANNFSEWNFPDPTFGGLFPNLTNNEARDFLFPGGALDWEKEYCSY